jgi:hypothetical protein
MLAMAIRATGRINIPFGQTHAMQPLRILFLRIFVTLGAIDRFELIRMWIAFGISMAINTVK